MGRELSLQESGWDPWEFCSGITVEFILPTLPSVMVAIPRSVCLWLQCTREYTHVTGPMTCRTQIISLNQYKKLWSTSVASFFYEETETLRSQRSLAQVHRHSKREWAGLYHAVWLLNLCTWLLTLHLSKLAILAGEWRLLLATNSWICAFNAPSLKYRMCRTMCNLPSKVRK